MKKSANYINNAQIKALDDGLQFLIYPAGALRFTVHDGTDITCTGTGVAAEVALTSRPRPIVLKLFGAEPAAVALAGAPLPKLTGRF